MFLQRRHADGQQASKKMFNIANHQKNVNQNYKEVPPHISQNNHHLKNNYKEQVLESTWRKGNPPIPLWECKLVQALWKTVWRFHKKIKVELSYDPADPLLGIYPDKLSFKFKKIHSPQYSLQNYLQQPRHGDNINVYRQMNG